MHIGIWTSIRSTLIARSNQLLDHCYTELNASVVRNVKEVNNVTDTLIRTGVLHNALRLPQTIPTFDLSSNLEYLSLLLISKNHLTELIDC